MQAKSNPRYRHLYLKTCFITEDLGITGETPTWGTAEGSTLDTSDIEAMGLGDMFETILGTYNDKQVPNTYSQYANMAMETLMLKCQPIMEKSTGLKLYPAYTYARIYKKGDILKRHKDRFSCEISATMNLGGDDWPIYLDPTNTDHLIEGVKYKIIGNKGIKVHLNPGDILVYEGSRLEHWREKFRGKECVQAFLHYNNVKTPGAMENMFDRRPHLGLPEWFKGFKLSK